jgi:ferredoxin-NADP reductase
MPQKILSTVTEVVEHGERVYSIFLKSTFPAPRFLPGQFLHLALDPYNSGDFWPESRVFSIASAPSDRQTLRLTYSVKGQFTSRMEAELYPGREVWLKLPYGEFTIDTTNDACLLAGGTGITAFTAFLAELPADFPHRVYLVYGARRPELLIYRSLAESAAGRCPNLGNIFLAELASADCQPGRIDPDLIWKNIPNPLEITYYLAGPPEMLRSLTHELRQRGVAANRIVTDAWE